MKKICKQRKENGLKRKPASESCRQKVSIRVRNLIWITDGISNKRIHKDLQIPSGWLKGRSMNPKMAEV